MPRHGGFRGFEFHWGEPDLEELKSTSACLACEGTMLHLYYTALFGVIGANAITILVAIAIAISRRKHDSEH